MRILRPLSASLLVALVTLTGAPVWACSCSGLVDPDAYLRDSDAGFVGVAREMEDPDSGGDAISSARKIYWTFEVERALKGDIGEETVVTSAADGASCGFRFMLGDRYRVHATRDEDGDLSTGSCQGNERLDSMGRLAAASQPQETPADTGLVAGLAGLTLLTAGSAIYVGRRRMRSRALPHR